MDSLIELIGILAWPLTTLALGFIFKSEFRKILSRLSKVKYKDIEASFDKELTEIDKRNQKIIVKSNFKIESNNYYENFNRLLGISKISPRAAISESWRELEASVCFLLKSLDYNIDNIQVSKVFRNLLNDNNYPPTLYSDYKNLNVIRNKVTHSEDIEISQFESEKYIKTALDITTFVQKMKEDINLIKPDSRSLSN